MLKYAGVLVMAGLLTLTTWKNDGLQKPKVEKEPAPLVAATTAGGEKNKPSPIEGVWEATVKRMDGSREVIQRIVFRDGRMRYTRPNDSPEADRNTAVSIEAEYTFVEGAPLSGKVLSATGETKAVKGDTFSLGWEIDRDRLALVEPKGKGLDGALFGKVFWTRKP